MLKYYLICLSLSLATLSGISREEKSEIQSSNGRVGNNFQWFNRHDWIKRDAEPKYAEYDYLNGLLLDKFRKFTKYRRIW